MGACENRRLRRPDQREWSPPARAESVLVAVSARRLDLARGLVEGRPIAIVHFQYGPIVAVLAVPGRLLGDVRLSSALATAALVVAVLAASRRSSSSMARLGAPLAVAVMPFTLGMILEAWVDVLMMSGFAGWLIRRRDHPRLAVVCLAACFR